jgi:hypothetical protein|tara:strand:+ start:1857 stop:2102 length:246 start_codon:yes stop_codon:yes gene_type:complete
MNESDIILILKLLLLFSAVSFLVIMITVPHNNCDNCSFNLKNKKLDTGEIIDEYFAKCIDPFTGELNKAKLNFTGFNESVE